LPLGKILRILNSTKEGWDKTEADMCRRAGEGVYVCEMYEKWELQELVKWKGRLWSCSRGIEKE